MLVHNAHDVELDRATQSMAFVDRRMQYAFRQQAVDLLLANKGNMGVALFDLYMSELKNNNAGT